MGIANDDAIKQFESLMEGVDESLKNTFENIHQGYPSDTYVRFLRASDWNIEKAHKMLVDSLNRRVQNEIDNILKITQQLQLKFNLGLVSVKVVDQIGTCDLEANEGEAAVDDNDEIAIMVEDDETGDASANPMEYPMANKVTELLKEHDFIQAEGNAFNNNKKNLDLMLKLSIASLAFSAQFLAVGKASEAGEWVPVAASLVGVITSWKSLDTTRKWVREIGLKIATASVSTAISFFAVNKFLDLPKDKEIWVSTVTCVITSATMCWL